MFDEIRCKFPLPDPANAQELTGFNFNSLFYQTKDFDCLMDAYEIRADGTLWKDCYESVWIEGDKKGKSFMERFGHSENIKEWQEQLSYTGEIVFYTSYGFDDGQNRDALKNDYSITYKAVFINGKLIEMKVESFEVTNNAERKKNELQWKKEMQEDAEFRSRWYIRYSYLPYERAINWFFRKLSWSLQKLPPLYRIQRWLTPF